MVGSKGALKGKYKLMGQGKAKAKPKALEPKGGKGKYRAHASSKSAGKTQSQKTQPTDDKQQTDQKQQNAEYSPQETMNILKRLEKAGTGTAMADYKALGVPLQSAPSA